jgi:hypothetical protein
MTDTPQKVVVPVESATKSRINWVQAAGIISSVAAFAGVGNLDPVQISQVIIGIQALVALVTIVLRTFSTRSVTPQVAAELPSA